MENTLLSISIPTYNRCNILRDNIIELIPVIKCFNIPIYISDNCSTDMTESVVHELKTMYPFIHYFKQEENILDQNFAFVLKQSKTKFTWLLGDKNRVNPQSIQMLLEIIESNDFDAIILNDESNRVKNIDTKLYDNHNDLLKDLGWHMTLISSLIFSKSLISNCNFSRFYNTNFIHTASIFEYIAKKKPNVYWINKPYVLYPKIYVTKSWKNETLNIFINIWSNSILSLPPIYTLDSKLICIKKHGIESKTFSFLGFCSLRSENIFNFSSFRKNTPLFFLVTSIPNILLFFISITPIFIFKLLKKVK